MAKIITMSALIRYTRNADGTDTRRVREFGMGKAHYTKRAFNLNNKGYLDFFAVENVKVEVTERPGALSDKKLIG